MPVHKMALLDGGQDDVVLDGPCLLGSPAALGYYGTLPTTDAYNRVQLCPYREWLMFAKGPTDT